MNKLLPHKYQMPALVVFLVSLILLVGFTLFDVLSPSFADTIGHTVMQVIIIVLLYASLLITIFSTEKIEDEMMTSMRLHPTALRSS